MKTIFIGVESSRLQEMDLFELNRDEAFHRLMTEYALMESHVIYFSAGESKIKEILIRKDPSFSL